MQPDRHAVDAERLDGLVQVDEALLDVEPLRGELLRDVGRGDRPEQLAFLADARREGELHLFEALRELAGALAAFVLGRHESAALGTNALQVTRGGLIGEAAGQEEVAGIAVLDSDDVPRMSEVLDRLAKDDFH